MIRKVVFIESASEMGGVEFSTLFLASHLNPDSWKVTAVCPSEGPLAAACRDRNVNVEIVPMPGLHSTSFRVGNADTLLPNLLAWVWNGFAILVSASRLKKHLLKNRPDLVVTKGIYAHLCGGLAAKQSGTKVVWHLQDLISGRFGGLYSSFFGLIARLLPTAIVTDGTPISRQLPADIQDRVSVVLNGIDVQVFRPRPDAKNTIRQQFGISSDVLVVGHAARLTPWKGQHYLLEAFGKISSSYPKVRLLLVGAATFDNDLYEKRLRARTKEMGLDHQVIFAGFRSDLAEVLAAMDIFAYPSVEKDTSPLALLSAMACGLPVVGFDIEGVREVLEGTGMLVPVKDVARLAGDLEKLIQNPTLRDHVGMQSRETAVSKFSLEQYASGMESFFLRDFGK